MRPDAVISTCRCGQSIHTDSNEQLTVHLARGMITCLASKLTIANTNQIKQCVTVEKKSERLPGKNATTRAHIVTPLYIHLLAMEHVQCFISCTMINYNSTDHLSHGNHVLKYSDEDLSIAILKRVRVYVRPVLKHGSRSLVHPRVWRADRAIRN